MNRYIDAEVLVKKMQERGWRHPDETTREFVEDDLPAADVQEVRHGRWEDVEPAPYDLFYATCSVCGERQVIEVANYCPMCGASMDEVNK